MFLKDHNKIAVTHGDSQISYRELLASVAGYAELLPEGARRVMLFAENRPEWISSFYAIWQRGAQAVPVDYLATASEIRHILDDCAPDAVFCSQERRPLLDEALAATDPERRPRILVFDEIVIDNRSLASLREADPQDTALILYTSGTTGVPKGVMLSFDNLLANIEAVSVDVPIFNRAERCLVLLPLHHIFPLMGTLIAPLFTGGSIAICPSLKAEDIVATLCRNRITVLIGVPRLYALIAQSINRKISANRIARLLYAFAARLANPRVSRLLFGSVHRRFGGAIRYLVSGGAALDPEVYRLFTTLGFTVLEGYGLTETAPMITFTRPGESTAGSAGRPLSGIEFRIVDEELQVRGRNVMKGYLNHPRETADILRNGWLHTGDLGRLDEQGRLFITGRSKEILVLANGKNVNPAELEQALCAHTPFIEEVGVFIADGILQAIIRPNLARIREAGVTEIEEHFRWQVLDPFNRSVSPAKRIVGFTLVDEELPRTRLSKLKRFLLPAMVQRCAKRRDQDAVQPDAPEYAIIKAFIEEQTSRTIHPDDHLEIDIAMDSLDRISLLEFLKKTFGVEIGEEGLLNHQTVRRLSDFISERKERVSVGLVNWREILKEKVELTLPQTWFTTNLFKNTARLLFRCYFRVTGEGRENLPPTPCIIAPNHQSFFDGLLVASQFGNRFMRNTYFYAKKKHVRNALVRFLADRNNVVIMDINADVKESIQKLAALIERGKNVMIFPEGTRSRDGGLGDFKKTFAILSKELSVPVVPVSIKGAFDALPTGKMIPKPFSRIRVSFRPPVFPDGLSYESIRQVVQQQVQEGLR